MDIQRKMEIRKLEARYFYFLWKIKKFDEAEAEYIATRNEFMRKWSRKSMEKYCELRDMVWNKLCELKKDS